MLEQYYIPALNYMKYLVESEKAALEYLKTMDAEEQAGIVLALKKINAFLAVEKGVNMMDKCYTCQYRRDLAGDCHSSCTNKSATVIGNEHGISKGWFFHPFNYDPTWLRYCDGYQEKSTTPT